MNNDFWTMLSANWGWILWFAMIILVFSSFGNWNYTYQAHRKYNGLTTDKDTIDILTERYAQGELNRAEFLSLKDEILSAYKEKNEKRVSAGERDGFKSSSPASAM